MAKKGGFRVCPYLAGHGVGSVFHGPPEILHTGVHISYYKLNNMVLNNGYTSVP